MWDNLKIQNYRLATLGDDRESEVKRRAVDERGSTVVASEDVERNGGPIRDEAESPGGTRGPNDSSGGH